MKYRKEWLTHPRGWLNFCGDVALLERMLCSPTPKYSRMCFQIAECFFYSCQHYINIPDFICFQIFTVSFNQVITLKLQILAGFLINCTPSQDGFGCENQAN